jgi:hypothetical protein
MKTIRDLNAPPDVVGRVDMVIVRGQSRDRARRVDATQALAGIGLADDRLGLRRNLMIGGINLLALKNARLQVGEAVLRNRALQKPSRDA